VWYNKALLETTTLNNALQPEKKVLSKIWKIDAPTRMIHLRVQSGKFVDLTPNTRVLRIKNGRLEWATSETINEGDYIATPRKLPEGTNKPVYAIDILCEDENICVENNVALIVKKSTDKLIEKYGSIQNIARAYGVSRNRLYLWRSKKCIAPCPFICF